LQFGYRARRPDNPTARFGSSSQENSMDFGIGLATIGLAAVLIYFSLPDKEGNSPRFLRFDAAMVLYPPIVLVVGAFGVAELFYSLVS
jgi:hypothetical protein